MQHAAPMACATMQQLQSMRHIGLYNPACGFGHSVTSSCALVAEVLKACRVHVQEGNLFGPLAKEQGNKAVRRLDMTAVCTSEGTAQPAQQRPARGK